MRPTAEPGLRQHLCAKSDSSRRISGLLLVLLTLLALPAQPVHAQAAELFPRPAQLEPAIEFWTRVYTEADTQHGFLHDSVNLSVIYDKVPQTRRVVDQRREEIQRDLEVLASGKRHDLTAEQQRILDLWGSSVTNQILEQAVSTVRFQLGQSDRFLGGLVRSGAYRDHIGRVIGEKGLPMELAVLPHVESSFNPRAYSSASAAGMWQFGRATGQRFMRIDHIIDERMDPYIATSAAMSLLEYNYSILGTWPLALTAYNHGAGGIARAVRDTGSDRIEVIIANYKGRAFGFASRNFYPQFLAVLDVEKNAGRYFGDVRFDPAPGFTEVTTDSYIAAEVFASSVGISLEQLRADNPALRPTVWEGGKRIPQGFNVKVRTLAVPGTPEQLLARIPTTDRFLAQIPDTYYLVERGDSLSAIASRFDTSVSQLTSLNQLASQHRIQIGQRLLLPQDSNDPDVMLATRTLERPGDGTYNVRRGDTLSIIATRFEVGEGELMRLNDIQDPHRIYPGQELSLPVAVENEELLAAADNEPESAQDSEAGGLVSVDVEATTDDLPEIVSAELDPTPAETENPTTRLALNQTPEALEDELPDLNEITDAPAAADENAVAVNPNLNADESNEELTEALSADPSDYTVAGDNSVEIQASETLGHLAEWLDVRAWDLRRLNDMAYRDPVIIGERLKLDLSQVTQVEFEVRRREYHLQLQQEFFGNFRIQDVETYVIAANDNIGAIARTRYGTPIWLLRQYNPELNFNRLQIGQQIVFPLLERAE
ncbi:MAG: LysM peptidoglycan-binding domain-containing protein [Pseudohongiellaceae bacterium]